jgi:senataxin
MQGKAPIVRDLTSKPRSPTPDSGSSASSSDEDEATGLAALERLQQSPARLKRLEPLRPAHNSVNVMSRAAVDRDRQRQNAQRIKNRLKPDVNEFYRTILSWDAESAAVTLRSSLPTVPASFRNAAHYREIMAPLFYEEVWTHSLQAAEEANQRDKVIATITAKYRTDDFVDIECNIPGRLPDKWMINEQDLLILEPSAQAKDGVPRPLPIFAKVQMVKRIGQNVNVGLRMLRDPPDLQMQKRWTLQKHIG